jgi:hypothetical protein
VRTAPNREMVADWQVSPCGGDGNGGGRKNDEDHGSSVAGVDERRARVAVGGGELGGKRRECGAVASSF